MKWGGGTSYYFRGAVTNNYVKFANYWWRIIRINGDGTVRLIYDGTEGHENGTETTDSLAVEAQKYNAVANQSNYVGWTYEGTSQRPTDNATATASNAKTQLESWYNDNLASYTSKIADGKYCNDRDVQSGSTWAINGNSFYYAAYKRVNTSRAPTLSCNSGDVYTLKVGLITVDEISMAGGTSANNASYYLYNGQDYWTMTPFRWNVNARVFHMFGTGSFYYTYVHATYGLRPVINLKADVAVTGTGILTDPYIVA